MNSIEFSKMPVSSSFLHAFPDENITGNPLALRNVTQQTQGDKLAVVRGLSNPGIFRPGQLGQDASALSCPHQLLCVQFVVTGQLSTTGQL